jgi:hypothetical protein
LAKEAGFPYTVSVDDAAGTLRDISNDVTNFQFGTPRGVQDVTGVDKSAMERLLLLADASFSPNGVFNDAANFSHAVFKTVPSSSVQRTVTLSVSGQSLSMEMLFTDYSLTRAQDGSLVWTAPAVLANGAVPTWS